MKILFTFIILLNYLNILNGNPLNINREYFLKYITLKSFKLFYLLNKQQTIVNKMKFNSLQSHHNSHNSHNNAHSNVYNVYNVNVNNTHNNNVNKYQKKVLVFIPGHGCHEERTKTILNNLLILNSGNNNNNNNIQIDCTIILLCELLSYIKERIEKYCNIQYDNDGQGSYSHYLKSVTPQLIKQSGYDYILILLDDAQLSYNYNLDSLISTMNQYSLSAISPSIIHSVYPSSACPFCQPRLASNNLPPYLKTIIPPINKNTSSSSKSQSYHYKGYFTDSIETFAVLFTSKGWRCFHSMIEPTINSVGWSYDRC